MKNVRTPQGGIFLTHTVYQRDCHNQSFHLEAKLTGMLLALTNSDWRMSVGLQLPACCVRIMS